MADKKASQTQGSNSYYSYLLIYKQRRILLTIALIATLAICTFIIASAKWNDQTWQNYGLLVLAIASTLLCIPMTEEWQYQPWQTRARRNEKIMFD